MSARYWTCVGWSILSSLEVITLLSCIFLSPAIAASKQITATLNLQENQTFPTLKQQAESLAGNLVRQAFAQSPDVTEISITIEGEHNGQEVPLVVATVTRSDWQKEPKIQLWSRYLVNSEVLLGFLKPSVPHYGIAAPSVPNANPVAGSGYDRGPNFYD